MPARGAPPKKAASLLKGRLRVGKNEAVHVRILAAQHTELAIETLASICGDRSEKAVARILAAQALLDRGWGKPSQPFEFEVSKWSDEKLRSEVKGLMEGQVTGDTTEVTTYVDSEFDDSTD